jgi:diguanylate cyclase (GGDEF)-like protein/PAS domain S-box-containing protein
MEYSETPFCSLVDEYRMILQNLNDGIWRIDEKGKTNYVSSRMAAMLGYSVTEMMGKDLFEFMDGTGKRIAEENIERRKQGIKEQHEFEFLKKDGTRVYTFLETSPIIDEKGVFRGAVAGVTDITGRHMAERALKKFRKVVETAGHGIYITDRDGCIEYVNPALSSFTGYAVDELVGKQPSLFKSNLMPPDYYRRLWKSIQSGRIWNEEIVNRKKNGDVYYALQTIAAFQDEHEEIEGFVAIQADITERRNLELSLKESEARYRSVVSAMSEGVVLQDRDGKVIAANESAERILGYPLVAMEGKTSSDPIWKAVREDGSPFPGTEHPAVITLKTNQPCSEVVMGLRMPEGKTTWISINSQPIIGEGEIEPHAVVTTFIDITERKEREEEIQRISATDHLTSIYNRRKFHEVLATEAARSFRYGSSLSLIIFDIDHFKKINDTYGHDMGDTVLKTISEIVGSLLRASDIFARWGGEEFIILLPHTEIIPAQKLTERIRMGIEQYSFPQAFHVTASFGVTTLSSEDKMDLDGYLKRADRALYRAKNEGRNRVCILV